MATKKKSNYIGEELDWLEERCKELREWVQSKLAGGITDRIEIFEGGRVPIIKVISSEETQIKCLRDTLKELPSMLFEINRLRKLAEDEESEAPSVRGNYDIPGFMEEDDEEDSDIDAPISIKSKSKQEKEAPKKSSPNKLLSGPSSRAAASFAEDEDDLESIDQDDDGDFENP